MDIRKPSLRSIEVGSPDGRFPGSRGEPRSNQVDQEERGIPMRVRGVSALLLAAALLSISARTSDAFTWPWETGGPWPTSSKTPVQPLAHPVLQSAVNADAPLQFAVYGDQRALADGEWQDLVARVKARHERDPLAFILDTGDIVQDGRHSDQFAMLTQILSPVRELPYFVAVGNHEVKNNESADARRNTARCLALTDDSLRPEKLYYSKQIGAVRLLFLDTNDLAYGPTPELLAASSGLAGSPEADPVAGQIHWLDEELAQLDPDDIVVVAMHHPFLQSSKKHREQAIELWNQAYGGHTLPERFLDAGVDLVLVGHTHTYERFRVGRGDRHFELVNVSGRPRTSLLWMGDGARRAEDIRGDEMAWLAKNGWEGLEAYTITQSAVMAEDERNQYAVVGIQSDGRIDLEVVLVDGAEETTFERVTLP